MTKVIGIDHVQLAMPHGGEYEARQFFVDVLGMTEIPKPAHLAIAGGCWFTSGTAHIHCGVEQDFTPAQRAHPALLVDDLPSLVTRLEENGIPFASGKPLDGYKRGDILDPFGNRIELMERVEITADTETATDR